MTSVTRGHDGLGERVQQLRAAAHDAVPLLADAGQVAGHVDEHDERHAERVAHPHEPGGLLGRGRVQAAAEPQRVVRDHADRAAAEPAERGHHVRRPARVQLDAGIVEDAVDQRVHVVGALRASRAAARRGRRRRASGRSHVVAVLVAEQQRPARARCASASASVGRDDVHHAGAPAVRLGAAEPLHVDVLAGDAAHHVGAGDEDPALVGQDHQVGQRRAVRGAAGGRAEHHRDLRHLADARVIAAKIGADRVQALDALAQPGAAGVPQPDDRERRSPAPGRRRRRSPRSPREPIAPPWNFGSLANATAGMSSIRPSADQHAAGRRRAEAAAPSRRRTAPRAWPAGRGQAERRSGRRPPAVGR